MTSTHERAAAYDKIDRFLRNSLGDTDYAEYSAALECVFSRPLATAQVTPGAISGERLAHIVIDTIHGVENRCMAADGPVTPTHAEITDDELRKVYKAAVAILEETK